MTCLTIADLGREYIARATVLYERAEKISRLRGTRAFTNREWDIMRSLRSDADRCRLEGLRLIHYYDRTGEFSGAHPRL